MSNSIPDYEVPLNGQAALDHSIALSPDGQWRLGISCSQFVLLSMSRPGFFQGEVVTWSSLDEKAQAELIRLGWTDTNGTILLNELKY